MQKMTSAELRRKNISSIYNFIYRSGGATRQEIQQQLQLSLPTIAQDLRFLEQEGLVRMSGLSDSRGGRRPQALECDAAARYAIGVELLKESFAKVLHPTEVAFSWLMVAVLLASILVKLWMSRLNRQIGTAIDSETLLATAADARNDVITTAAVLAATILTKLTGFARIDGLMGIGVAAFILYSGAMLVKDTINPLLGAAPDSDLVEHIEKKALSYPGVLGVHDLMIHDYGPGSRLVSFHLEMDAKDDVMRSHDVIDRIERDLLVEDGLIATIHFDPVVTGDPHADELKAFLQREVEELAPLANIHDLRIVPGPTHTNVIFDCAVPAEYMTDKQHRGVKLVNALRNAVQAKWPDHFCVIKLEPDYAPVHHE